MMYVVNALLRLRGQKYDYFLKNANLKEKNQYDREYRRKNKENYLVIFVDLWDMRRSPRYLIRQFKRKL